MPRSSPVRRPRLWIEPLERRDTPAGTVMASLAAGGTLTLTGDDAGNIVEVRQTGDGAFSVFGSSTLIQGGPDFTGVTSVVANFGAGDGSLSLSSSVDLDADGPVDVVVPGSVTVNMGDGNNQFYLVPAGKISLGSLTVNGGDGQDVVQVSGGAGKGSKIVGNVSFSLGIGVDSQEPPYLDTTVTLGEIALMGAGGLKFSAGEGPETLTLNNVNLSGVLKADGGEGNLSVVTFGGTLGSVSLNSAGPSTGMSTNAASLAATGTTVLGTISLKSADGANLIFTNTTSGAVTISGGKQADTYAEMNGINTVHGAFKITGHRHTLLGRAGSHLTVDGDISITGSGYVDLNTTQSVFSAKNVSLTGGRGANYYNYDSDPATAGKLIVTGAMTLKGKSVDFEQTGNEVSIGTKLTLQGVESASLFTYVGSDVNAPGAKLSVPTGAILVQGDSADVHLEGADLTAASLSIVGKEEASFGTENGLTTDPSNNDIVVPANATITGPLKVDGGSGELDVSIDGDSLHVTGDMTLHGEGLNRIWLEAINETRVDGNLKVSGAKGSFDWFLAWGPLTVGKDLSVDLGNGANAIETGTKGGTTTVNGNLTLKVGNGSDKLDLASLIVAGTTTINTGAGSDQVYLLSGSKFSGAVNVDLGSGADAFRVAVALPDPFSPTPIVAAGKVEFDGKAMIKLGSGNDLMALGVAGDPNGKVVFGGGGSLSADGGANLDTFNSASGQFDAGVTTTGFELS